MNQNKASRIINNSAEVFLCISETRRLIGHLMWVAEKTTNTDLKNTLNTVSDKTLEILVAIERKQRFDHKVAEERIKTGDFTDGIIESRTGRR